MVNSSWTAGELVRAIGSDRLQVLWDPANNCWAHEPMYPEGYEPIRGIIGHIHMKDVVVDTPKATLEVRQFGKGALSNQFAPTAAALKTDGYDGVVSLESVFHPGNDSYEEGFRMCVEDFKSVFG